LFGQFVGPLLHAIAPPVKACCGSGNHLWLFTVSSAEREAL
jgi:hypothetical protein